MPRRDVERYVRYRRSEHRSLRPDAVPLNGPTMARRTSIYIEDFVHKNPIPNACRVGSLVISGVIVGIDPATGRVPPTLAVQCAFMFGHMKRIIEAAGGSTDDIIKVTVWLKDRSQRQPLNEAWIAMFPDESTRPARHAIQSDLEGGVLIQCDFTAWLGP